MDIQFYILTGGPIVLLLLVLLILVLIIVVERFLFFRSYEFFLNTINKKILEKNLNNQNMKELTNSLIEEEISSNWILFLNKIQEISTIKKDSFLYALEESYKYLLNSEIPKMEKYLIFLATLGNLSPFIGLLGTVFGIIRSFMHLGESNITEVNKGIAEALIATAFGLMVAIPASFSYNLFRKKIDRCLILYENWITNLKLKLLQSE
ncbi:MAG: MotA/TolQ/ExbB proton channel family protein [Leptonema sp. (in: bacteria)]